MFFFIKTFLLQYGVPLKCVFIYLEILLLSFNGSNDKFEIGVGEFIRLFLATSPMVICSFIEYGFKGFLFLLILTCVNLVLSFIQCCLPLILRFLYHILAMAYIGFGSYYLYMNYFTKVREFLYRFYF